MCRYAQFYAFISVIELPRIPAYCPKFQTQPTLYFYLSIFISAPSFALLNFLYFPIFLAHLPILLYLHNLPIDNMEDPVRIRRQMVIMRDHNQRLVLFPDDPLHQFQHIHRRVRIQISSRLIRKLYPYPLMP